MKVYTPDPAKVLDGRLVFDVSGLKEQTVWLPKVSYPRPTYLPWRREVTTTAGFYQCVPDKYPYLDACAYWTGSVWKGSAGEIEKCKLPGYKRRVKGTVPGTRGYELWPDSCATLANLTLCTVFVNANDAPAEIVRAYNCHNCAIHVWGSGNRVRAHGNRPLCLDTDGEANVWYLHGPTTPGCVLRLDGSTGIRRFGFASGLSVLSDMGTEYVRGEGYGRQGSLMADSEVCYTKLAPEFAPVSFTTASYLDNGASQSQLGTTVALGQFAYSAVVGGGSDNDLSGVWSDSGRDAWIESRAHWPQMKEWGYPLEPTGNTATAVTEAR